MPSYKLCYFNARGLGEMARLVFAEAGVEYEDCRVQPEEWPKVKSTMPFGQMPVLYVDGEPIAHSRALVRYLAREFKLEGGNSFNAAIVDVWIETLFETFSKLPFSEKDTEKKKELLEKVKEEFIFPKMKQLEKQINSSSGPYLLSEFSAGDIVVYAVSEFLEKSMEITLSEFKAVTALKEKVAERPKIAKWLKNRPVTQN